MCASLGLHTCSGTQTAGQPERRESKTTTGSARRGASGLPPPASPPRPFPEAAGERSTAGISLGGPHVLTQAGHGIPKLSGIWQARFCGAWAAKTEQEKLLLLSSCVHRDIPPPSGASSSSSSSSSSDSDTRLHDPLRVVDAAPSFKTLVRMLVGEKKEKER